MNNNTNDHNNNNDIICSECNIITNDYKKTINNFYNEETCAGGSYVYIICKNCQNKERKETREYNKHNREENRRIKEFYQQLKQTDKIYTIEEKRIKYKEHQEYYQKIDQMEETNKVKKRTYKKKSDNNNDHINYNI